jgi:hypothetical protein
MIIIIIGVVGVLSLFLFYGPLLTTEGSGNLVTEAKDFTGFSEIDIGDGFEVTITQSSTYSISIKADDNIIDRVEVSKSGERLDIKLRSGIYNSITLEAEITLPDLHELTLSEGTQGIATGFTEAHNFILDLSGGSRIDLEGSSDNISIDASGGSQLILSDFSVHDANVILSGGSRATINLDGILDADLSGGSQLHYLGEPTLRDIETAGGSLVIKE